jgi:hypothetical protein
MDFMFEDEVDEVGSDVEAYCPKCKADTTHVVISKYEDEIRRVQCNPCGDVHSFRKPRGEVEDDVPEPIAAKKRAMLKKLNWDEFFAKHGEKQGKPYEFRERYTENVIVTHPKFGRGFVSEVMSDSKVEVTFKDARRVLVHNRKDMPGLPLAAEGDGIPSKGARAKAAKNKAAQDAKEAKEAKEARDAKEAKEAKEASERPAAKAGTSPGHAAAKGESGASGAAGASPKKGTAKPAAIPAKVSTAKPVTAKPTDKPAKPDLSKADKGKPLAKAKAVAAPAKAVKPAKPAKISSVTKTGAKTAGKKPASKKKR